MMEQISSLKNSTFDGSGDVKAFLTKIELATSIKGYTDDKLAAAIACRLDGAALDLYMRLPDEDKKIPTLLREELLKQFRGNRDREKGLAHLSTRCRKNSEPLQTYAFNIEEVVKLAYPDFDNNPRRTIVKDDFVKGLHKDMQLALTSISTFTSTHLKTLVDEACRLELAGINSYLKSSGDFNVNVVEESSSDVTVDNQRSSVEEVTENVLKKLAITEESVKFVGAPNPYAGNSQVNRGTNDRGRRPFNSFQNNDSQGKQNSQRLLKCRNCQSPQHLVRQCPTRFCQSCGGRGHDAWNKNYAKYS